MNVESRAHRILKRLKLYRPIGLEDDRALSLPPLPSDDLWIGIYGNVPGSHEDAVAFSSKQLHVHERDGWTSVEYKDILDTQISHDKSSADEVLVRTSKYNLPIVISGGEGKTRDVFEVLRFLNRVREDISVGPKTS